MVSTAELLIVSASTGTGHARAAEALLSAALRRQPGRQVEHVDLLELAPRWVRTAYGEGYELLASRAPWLWREVYRRTDASDGDRARWGPLAQRILFREFRRLLLSRPWSLCLSTHFLPGQLAAGSPGLPPFALVITDLTLHRFWAQPRVRRYFVGCEALASELRARVPGSRVDATGIPIAPRFEDAPNRAEARAALGLNPDRPVVLVMGGGLGLGMEETVAAVARAGVEGLQIIAVCGRNEDAADRLRAAGIAGDRLHAFGYVHDIERYLAAASLTVTKPGGLTTSEALALSCPLLLTRPIPGQEEGNTRVLCAAGAAVEATDPTAVTREVERIFRDPGRLNDLSASACAMGRPHAAADIVGTVDREYFSRAVA